MQTLLRPRCTISNQPFLYILHPRPISILPTSYTARSHLRLQLTSLTTRQHSTTSFPSKPKMKEVFVSVDPSSTALQSKIIDSPIPTPGPNQVVIRNVVAGTNPKDWKYPVIMSAMAKGDPAKQPKPQNPGDDVAGFVHAVGEGVTEFHVGDRVAAFHEMRTPHGAFAEYT
jgi:hypothetical protein